MYESYVQASAVKYGIPIPWIQAIIDVESAWKANAYRAEPAINDASYGLMQLLEGTARKLGLSGDVAKLYDPATNIDLGTKLLAENRARFGNSFERVYSAYNSGNPDLYLTSVEVAKNVTKAVTALTKYTNLFVSTAVGSPVASAMVMIMAGVLLLDWVKKK